MSVAYAPRLCVWPRRLAIRLAYAPSLCALTFLGALPLPRHHALYCLAYAPSLCDMPMRLAKASKSALPMRVGYEPSLCSLPCPCGLNSRLAYAPNQFAFLFA
jgi:hypothetical protein